MTWVMAIWKGLFLRTLAKQSSQPPFLFAEWAMLAGMIVRFFCNLLSWQTPFFLRFTLMRQGHITACPFSSVQWYSLQSMGNYDIMGN